MAIVRDRRTGRIVGVTKERPPWASSDDALRRLTLMPALRYLAAAKAFFQEGRSSIELARELGISKFAVRTFLGRIRKAVGAPRERLTEARRDYLPKTTFESIMQDGLQLNHAGVVRRSKGRHFADTWANNDRILREVVLGPALLWYDVARRYWLLYETAAQIGSAVGVSYRTVEGIVAVIRRHAENPQLAPRVYLARTRSGKARRARTIPS
jgi:hypothetical protein